MTRSEVRLCVRDPESLESPQRARVIPVVVMPAGLVELLHVERGRVIVRVSTGSGATVVSALGEAASAEEAEDRARHRLHQQGPASASATPVAAPEPASAPARPADPAHDSSPPPVVQQQPLLPVDPEPATADVEAAPAPAPDPVEPPAEPDDWSEELTAVEMELQRLGWDRESEGTYLQRAFGHPSRSRLVNYADVVSYLKLLRRLEPCADPAGVALPLRRPDLLSCCDELLGQLQWGAAQGRALLEERFGRASRQQLSDEQLLEFNQLLEEQLLSLRS